MKFTFELKSTKQVGEMTGSRCVDDWYWCANFFIRTADARSPALVPVPVWGSQFQERPLRNYRTSNGCLVLILQLIFRTFVWKGRMHSHHQQLCTFRKELPHSEGRGALFTVRLLSEARTRRTDWNHHRGQFSIQYRNCGTQATSAKDLQPRPTKSHGMQNGRFNSSLLAMQPPTSLRST